MEGAVELARELGREIKRESAGSDFGFNDEGSRGLGRYLVFWAELISEVLCCAEEYQFSHVESVCFDMFLGFLHIPSLAFAENLREVIPVSQKASYELPW